MLNQNTTECLSFFMVEKDVCNMWRPVKKLRKIWKEQNCYKTAEMQFWYVVRYMHIND
jgi:hypothetical protein